MEYFHLLKTLHNDFLSGSESYFIDTIKSFLSSVYACHTGLRRTWDVLSIIFWVISLSLPEAEARTAACRPQDSSSPVLYSPPSTGMTRMVYIHYANFNSNYYAHKVRNLIHQTISQTSISKLQYIILLIIVSQWYCFLNFRRKWKTYSWRVS